MVKIKGKLMMILVVALVLLSLGSVAATDDVANVTDVNETNHLQDSVNECVLTDELQSPGAYLLGETSSISNGNSFYDLNQTIANATGNTIELDRDYAYNSTTDTAFKEGINITKAITINGNNHIISGSNLARAFYINENVILTINNLTIANCNSTANGGAIYLTKNLNLICKDVCFVNNTAYDGGAIYAAGNVSINSNGSLSFVNNTATNSGGAIYAAGNVSVNSTGSVTFTGNTATKQASAIRLTGNLDITSTGDILFENNFANNTNNYDYGGAISAYKNAGTSTYYAVTITSSNGNVVFKNNTAKSEGGAIFGGNVSINAINLSFINNAANNGAAIYAISSVNVNAGNVNFVNNTAKWEGGVFNVVGNVIINSTGSVSFVNNTATGGSGGAIHAWGIVNITSSDDILFENNFANNTKNNHQGGAISTAKYVSSTFTYNDVTIASSNGNVVFKNNAAIKNGGAILGANVRINAINLSFINNSATIRGGAIFASSGVSVNAGNVSFVNNKATSSVSFGGAIYSAGNVSVDATSVSFVNNKATSQGGAISAGSSVSVNSAGSVSFVNSSADFGGAISAGSNVSVDATSVSFVNNNCTGFGGAINAGSNVIVNATNIIFNNNTAGISGGAIDTDSGNVIVNSIGSVSFVNNRANTRGGAISAGSNVTVSSTDGVSFINNTVTSSTGSGGAISARSHVTVSGAIFDNCTSSHGAIYITNGTYDLNGNYWCMNCIDESQFINKKLVYNAYKPIAPDNWVLMSITAPNNITVGKSYNFTVTLDKLCYKNGTITNFTGSLPDYTVIINGTNVKISNGAGIYNYTPNFSVFSLVATSPNSGNILCNSTFSIDSFTKLQALINDNYGKTLVLDTNYTRATADLDLVIDKAITIDANGFTINGNKLGGIFNVTSTGDLTLRNAILINGIGIYYDCDICGGAIFSEGKLSIYNSTFTGNTVEFGGAIWNSGDGFTVVDSTFANNTANFDGGAIFISEGDGFTVVNSTFIGNNADWAGAIDYGGVVGFTVVNSTFINNTAEWAGAIYTYDATNFTVVNSTFIGNNADDYGGAIFNSAGAGFNVVNSVFINNTAIKEGGAIENFGGVNCTISNSTFTNNTAKHGGALWISGTGTVSNSTFMNNSNEIIYNKGELSLENLSAGAGAYIANNGTIKSTVNVNVLDNESEIYVISGKPMFLQANVTASGITVIGEFIFTVNNTDVPASYDEDLKLFRAEYTPDFVGIKTVTGNLTGAINSTVLTASLFATTGNSFYDLNQTIESAKDNIVNLTKNYKFDPRTDSAFVDGIKINSTLTINGNGYTIDGSNLAGILNVATTGDLTLNNAILINGTDIFDEYGDTYGGAIYSEGTVSIYNATFINNTAKYGGVIYSEGIISIYDSTFIDNTANYGGAIDQECANLIVVNSTFINNTAPWSGGAIFDAGVNLTVVNSTFKDNTASYGGAIFNTGDGSKIVNSAFIVNNATNEGGAIENYGGANCTVINSTFKDNTASEYGGAIWNDGENYTVVNSDFIASTASEYGGAIYNKGGAGFTVVNSTFAGNTATMGCGAIGNEGDDSTIVNSTFINNTVGRDGIIENYGKNFSVVNSTFINNSNEIIYNEGELSLENNTATAGAYIVNNGTITSTVNVCVLGNETKTGIKYGDKYLLYATVDVDGIPIYYGELRFDGLASYDFVAEFDKLTGMFVYNYTVDFVGSKTVTANYRNASDCNVYTGDLVVAKSNAPDISVVADNTVAGEETTITIIVNNTDGMLLDMGAVVNVTVYGEYIGQARLTTVEPSSVLTYTLTYKPTTAGTKYVFVNYESDYFASNNNWTSFYTARIGDYDIIVNYNSTGLYVGDNLVINYTVKAKQNGLPLATGELIIIDNSGASYRVNLNEAAQANVTVKLNSATNSFVVYYAGDGNYNQKSYETVVEVPKNPITLIVDDLVNTKYGQKAVIAISAIAEGVTYDLNGRYVDVVFANGVSYKALVKDGAITFSVPCNTTYNGVFTVTLPETDYFASASNSSYLNISKLGIKLIINPSVINAYVADNVTVGITAVDENGNLWSLMDDTEVIVSIYDNGGNLVEIPATALSGQITVTLPRNASSGFFTVNVDGKDCFNVSMGNATINISKHPVEMDVYGPSTNVTYRDVFNVTGLINVADGNNVSVSIYRNGEEVIHPPVTATVKDGRFSVTFDEHVPAGNFMIVFDFAGSDYYESARDMVAFTINKAESNMYLNVKSVVYGETVTIIANLPSYATGMIVFTVNGQDTVVEGIKGTTNLTLSGLNAGEYNVTAKYFGDNNYLSSIADAVFTVEQFETDLIVKTNNTVYGDSQVITVDVTTVNGTGWVVLKINDEFAGRKPVSNETIKFVFDGKFVGNYTVLATYLGDGNNQPVFDYTTFEVYKKASGLYLDVCPSNNTCELIAKVIPDDVTGNVVFYVDDTPYTVALDEYQTAIFTATNLTIGEHVFEVVYTGDATHNESKNNGSIIVGTDLYSQDLEKYYHGEETFNVTLTDKYSNPISGETVNVTINGKTYGIITDENGVACLPIGLASGVYNVTATYDGIYGNASANNTITVKKTVFGNDTELYYRNGSSYVVSVLDSTGKAVKNGTVVMNINGVFYTCAVVNGTASLPIGLLPGKYIVTVENLVNGELTSNIVTVLSTIQGNNTTIYQRTGGNYTVYLTDGQGNALDGVNVTMNINGVFYTRAVVNGTASLPIGLIVGEYIITVYNPVTGESSSNIIDVTNSIIADDLVMVYRDGSAFNATVLDASGLPAENELVTLKINGVSYSGYSDVNGVYSVPIGLMPGQYAVTAYYGTSAVYKDSVVKTIIVSND